MAQTFSAEEVKAIVADAIKMALSQNTEAVITKKAKETAVGKTAGLPANIREKMAWALDSNVYKGKYEGKARVKREGGTPYTAFVYSYVSQNGKHEGERLMRAVTESGWATKHPVKIIRRLE